MSLPGEPLPSGFRPCNPAERKRAELSPEARARVEATVRSSARARAAAHAASITAAVG